MITYADLDAGAVLDPCLLTKPAVIRGAFRANDGWSSQAIECFGGGRLSHVDIMLSSGQLLGARSDRIKYQGGVLPAGVQIRPHDYEKTRRMLLLELTVPHEKHAAGMAFLKEQLRKPYDKIGIVDFALCKNRHRNWRQPTDWWCSELFAAFLEAAGVIAKAPRDLGCMVTPGTAAWLFVGAGATVPRFRQNLVMGVRCFFIEPTDRARRWLRRYVHSEAAATRCPGPQGYHHAMHLLDEIPSVCTPGEDHWPIAPDPGIAHTDARWPAKCEACEYAFTAADEHQVFTRQIYVDQVSGNFHTLDEKVPGMMWDAFWSPDCWKGPDGRCLVVVCPNGSEWMIDGQASNCTAKNDQGPYGVAHRCWCRTGEPPLIVVSKTPGRTCAAGAGSIQAGNYHGFLGCQGAPPGHFT